jgi:hypothetical protein
MSRETIRRSVKRARDGCGLLDPRLGGECLQVHIVTQSAKPPVPSGSKANMMLHGRAMSNEREDLTTRQRHLYRPLQLPGSERRQHRGACTNSFDPNPPPT